MSDENFSIQSYMKDYEVQHGGGRGFDGQLGRIARTADVRSMGSSMSRVGPTSLITLSDPRPFGAFAKKNKNKKTKK